MTERGKGLFAGRGITLRTVGITMLVMVLAFALGIGVGWGTGQVGDYLSAPQTSPSPSPSPEVSPMIDVSVPPLAPIDRELDDDDRRAGLTSLDVPVDGAGSFSHVTLDREPSGGSASVRWVRVEYEDGLSIAGSALADFVMTALNDPRGWGARGRYEFVPTSGAPDLRVVIASPRTVAATCPQPHASARVGAADANGSPEPTASPEATVAVGELTCADQGLVMISLQDWAAGLEAYGEDRTDARVYLVQHFLGHALGEQEKECSSGVAPVMADQAELADDCTPNPWPWPDEPVPDPTPSPTSFGLARPPE